MIRTILILSSVVSLFMFPYPLTLVLSFLGSILFPPVGVVVGILGDIFYYVPGASPFSLPMATLGGAGLTFMAFIVRRFIQTRII